jgi:hypothetical protein
VIVARLVVDVELLDDRVDLLAGKSAPRQVDVPLHDLAVEEQRRVGVAAAVIGRVQGPQAQLGLGDDGIARLDLVVEELIDEPRVDHGDGRRELAPGGDVDAVRSHVHAVRAVGDMA